MSVKSGVLVGFSAVKDATCLEFWEEVAVKVFEANAYWDYERMQREMEAAANLFYNAFDGEEIAEKVDSPSLVSGLFDHFEENRWMYEEDKSPVLV